MSDKHLPFAFMISLVLPFTVAVAAEMEVSPQTNPTSELAGSPLATGSPLPAVISPVTDEISAVQASDRDASGEDIAAIDNLKSRVQARWGALIERDFHRAYSYCSPAYRNVFTVKQYVERFGAPRLEWERVNVLEVLKEADNAARVKIQVFAKAFMPEVEKALPVSTVYTENWVLVGEEWWYSPST